MTSLIERAIAATELKWRKAMRECIHFITNYVYIEDRDAPELAVPFSLWPGQIKMVEAFFLNRLIILLKARQLGATWGSLSYGTWKLVFNPGYSVVALSKREDDAKELTRRIAFILRYLPKWMIREKKKAGKNFLGPVWEATSLTITIYHPNGEPSIFTAMSSGPDSGRSFTSSLVILDEWAFQQWAEEIWSAAYPTINRPTGGQVIGLSTNKRGSFFENIWKGAVRGDNGFHRIFIPWWADPRRTPEWYEQTKGNLPDSWRQEYPSTPEEAMSAGEGTSFPEFSYDIHVCRPFKIPYWWKRWICNDPGYTDPFTWYCMAVSETGTVYIYREFTRKPKDPKVAYSEQAKEMLKRCIVGGEVGQPELEDGKPVPEKFIFKVTGRDAWSQHPIEKKCIIDYYQSGGMTGFIEPPRDAEKTDRILRKATWHEYLKPYLDENTGRTTAKVQIFSTCEHLIEALPILVNDEKHSEKVALEPHLYTNAYDGAGYGLIAWHARKSKAPKPEKGRIEADKEKLAKKSTSHRTRRMLG